MSKTSLNDTESIIQYIDLVFDLVEGCLLVVILV